MDELRNSRMYRSPNYFVWLLFSVEEAVVSPDELLFVCSTRLNAVLTQDHILKSDHFPSGRDLKLPVQLPGAPNFRQVIITFVTPSFNLC